MLFDNAFRPVQQVTHSERLTRRRCVEEKEIEELIVLLGAHQLAEGEIPLRAYSAILNDETGKTRPGGDESNCGDRDRDTVAAHELCRPVSKGIGSGEYGLVFQITLEIVGEGRCGRITLGRIFLHRLGNDPVKIAAQLAGAAFRPWWRDSPAHPRNPGRSIRKRAGAPHRQWF